MVLCVQTGVSDPARKQKFTVTERFRLRRQPCSSERVKGDPIRTPNPLSVLIPCKFSPKRVANCKDVMVLPLPTLTRVFFPTRLPCVFICFLRFALFQGPRQRREHRVRSRRLDPSTAHWKAAAVEKLREEVWGLVPAVGPVAEAGEWAVSARFARTMMR